MITFLNIQSNVQQGAREQTATFASTGSCHNKRVLIIKYYFTVTIGYVHLHR